MLPHVDHTRQVTLLNLGCGQQTPSGWINVDYSLGARFAKIRLFRILNNRFRFFRLDWNENIFIHDISRPFPWSESSVDVIYTSHTLEHLTQSQGMFFVSECARVLRKYGILRIVVPDLRALVNEYSEGNLKAENFVAELNVSYLPVEEKCWKCFLGHRLFSPHKCMYDTPALLRLMQGAGFDAKPRRPFDSSILKIRTIEKGGRKRDDAIVEGRKI